MNILAAILCLATFAFAQEATDYKIGPGDTINVLVHGQTLNTTALRVSTDGRVSFPFIGMVEVSGLTPFEVERHLRAKLMEGYYVDPQVSVAVSDFGSKRIELFGAIKAGLYNLRGDTTIRALIAEAGGVDLAKSSGRIEVTRQGAKQVLSVADLDGDSGDFLLQAGDIIDVVQGNTIFLSGEVQKPGPVEYNRGLTAAQAVLMAGGRTEFARLSGTYIVREGERISVNLRKILKGKASDVPLLPGDRIVIPQSVL